MAENQMPMKAIPVMHALARSFGPVSFADIKDSSQLAQATLNRILNNLCAYGYAIKVGHGQYVAGPELVEMGMEVTRNRIVPGFKKQLSTLKRRTQLNAELYMITPSGPVFLTHSPKRGDATVPFEYGHIITNRVQHPAALFYLAAYENQRPEGYKENFIVDRGGQWPELFRAASMMPGGVYCLAVSGMLINVDEDRHPELKEALHDACKEIELP